jgi:hypothetical protein
VKKDQELSRVSDGSATGERQDPREVPHEPASAPEIKDGSASSETIETNGEAAFEAWAYSQAGALPAWWPDGERGEQAARFMAAAVKAAWDDGFSDEHVRYAESAWRHSAARQWADAARLLAKAEGSHD